MSESRTKLLVMCVTHGGIILKKTVKKFRGKDQITRLRPGDTGMHKKISETCFGAFTVGLFSSELPLGLSSNCVPCSISPRKGQVVSIEVFTCTNSCTRQFVVLG
jgi:hypothetical protein